MNYPALGEQIRKHRIRKGFTQRELAQRAGISESCLGLAKRGCRKTSLETVVKLANAFCSGTDELLQDSLAEGNLLWSHVFKPKPMSPELLAYLRSADC